jgi:S-formylglutathione hydrolase FrmB
MWLLGFELRTFRRTVGCSYPLSHLTSPCLPLLTCTKQNSLSKSGYQQDASELALIIINPDTSPCSCDIKDASWDFGTGAEFNANATEDPWKTDYKTHSYIAEELLQLVNLFPSRPTEDVYVWSLHERSRM